MGLVAKNKGGDFELVPEGMHIARCYRVIDCGTQYSEKWSNSSHKILIGWEFPEETMSDGRPFAVNKKYTCSLNKKASLRRDLESWRGKKFTDQEAEGFDVSKLLNAPCYINVVHEKSGENTYANVAAITPLPRGITCPPAVNPLVILDLDPAKFDEKVFEGLSDNLKEQIRATPEHKNIQLGGGAEDAPPYDDDSVPF